MKSLDYDAKYTQYFAWRVAEVSDNKTECSVNVDKDDAISHLNTLPDSAACLHRKFGANQQYHMVI